MNERPQVTLVVDGRRGRGHRGRDARRRGQGRRRRDPGLLLRAEARRPGRRLPHVPGRDRGDPEAADRVLDPGPRRDGRLHRAPTGWSRPRTRWSSSCSSTTRSTARSATRAASARCRTSRWAGARGAAGSPTRSATSASRSPLSPLVRIDRERCILCYRCVRFSQEVAEDEQLQLLERGASSYVGTFDDRPYIAPFHGNIIELCPVGALTSEAYRFRARPWDIEDSGSICTLCPSQCNVKFTVRDERVQRVLARDNHEVDNGWLCDKGRFGFQMISSEERITTPRLSGNRADWDRRRWRPPPSASASGERRDRGDRRRPGLERGGLPGPADRPRGARLAARDLDRRAPRRRRSRALSAPELGAAIADDRRGRVGAADRRRPAATRCRSSTCACARRCAIGAARWWSPPSARPRSTAAPRRPRATRPATAPPSSPRSPPSSVPTRPPRARIARRRRAARGRAAPGQDAWSIWGERLGRGRRRRDGARRAARDRRRARLLAPTAAA